MEEYNKYHESLNIDCNCEDKKQPQKKDNCCGGISLPSNDNQIEILIIQLKKEVNDLLKTTKAKLLCQDKKIAETMVYVKNNLSNYIRDLLNSMLNSGELDEIITDTILSTVDLLEETDKKLQNQITSEVETRENEDNNLQAQINSLASGSPIPVDSINKMTDTSRIYVNTSNGYWYYYNGSEWVQGDVYQSTGIANNSVDMPKIKFKGKGYNLFNKYNPILLNILPDATSQKFINHANSTCTYIPITGGETYTVTKKQGKRLVLATTSEIPAENTPIIDMVGSTTSANNCLYQQITASNTAKYLVVFYYNTGADTDYTETEIREYLMIQKGNVAFEYEDYYALEVNKTVKKNGLNPDRLKESYLRLYQGTINIDFNMQKIRINAPAGMICENGDARATVDSNINTQLDIPTDTYVYCLTATVDENKNVIKSYQLEHYQTRDVTHPIICWLHQNSKTWFAPFDYGNRISSSYSFLRLYKGTIGIDFNTKKITLSNNAEFVGGENGETRFTIGQEVSREIELVDNGNLYGLTAVVDSESNIISFQLEHYKQFNNSNPVILWVSTSNKSWFAPFDYGNRVQSTSNVMVEDILEGKKMGGLGDSLMAGSQLGNNVTALYKIAQKNDMTYINYGINGNPIANAEGYSGDPMCERYINMADDLDYIVVLGGANDRRLDVPIGTNSDTVTTTFKGALKTLIEGLLTKYPGKKILFMTNYNRIQGENNIGLTDLDYVNAMIEICGLYAIPCFDNYHDCGISWFTDLQTSWCDEGISLGGSINRHLSDEGYNFLVPVYENLLKKI